MCVRPNVCEHVHARTLTVYEGFLRFRERCERVQLEKREFIAVPIGAWETIGTLSLCQMWSFAARRFQACKEASRPKTFKRVCDGVAALVEALLCKGLAAYKCVFMSVWCECRYVFRNNFIHEVHKVHNTRVYLIKTLTCLFIHVIFYTASI